MIGDWSRTERRMAIRGGFQRFTWMASYTLAPQPWCTLQCRPPRRTGPVQPTPWRRWRALHLPDEVFDAGPARWRALHVAVAIVHATGGCGLRTRRWSRADE